MSNVERRRAATTGNALPGSTRPVPGLRPRWRMAAVGASACAVLGTGLVLATPPGRRHRSERSSTGCDHRLVRRGR